MKKIHPHTSNFSARQLELGRIPAHPHPDPDYLAYLDSLYTPLEGGFWHVQFDHVIRDPASQKSSLVKIVNNKTTKQTTRESLGVLSCLPTLISFLLEKSIEIPLKNKQTVPTRWVVVKEAPLHQPSDPQACQHKRRSCPNSMTGELMIGGADDTAVTKLTTWRIIPWLGYVVHKPMVRLVSPVVFLGVLG